MSIPLQQLTNENGIDLTQMVWWFTQADSPAAATPSELVQITFPLRHPIVLEGESGWIFCNIPVAPYDTPESFYYGTEVILGHLEGNDRTYWNNTLIGQTEGRSINQDGKYRRYAVPRQALQLGRVNQLRIRISGYGDRNTIPEIRPPFTLAPLTPVQAQRTLEDYRNQLGKLTRQVYRLKRWKPDFLPLLEAMAQRDDIWIEIDHAERLIAQHHYGQLQNSFREIEEQLKTLSRLAQPIEAEIRRMERQKYELDMVNIAALEGIFARDFAELQRRGWVPPRLRPESFARWGWFHHDGLPTLREVTPTYIENIEKNRISLLFDRVLDVQVVDVNWISKTYLVRAEVSLEERREIADFEIMTSVLYPGVLIFPQFRPYSDVLKVDTIQRFFNMPTKYFVQLKAQPVGELGGVFLGWDGREQESPMMLRFTPHLSDPLGLHISACFPGGTRLLDTRSWEDREHTPKDLSAFPHIEYLSRNFPWNIREYYRYDSRTDNVKIYNVFDYYNRPRDDYLTILPPVISFVRKNGYPVQVEPEVHDLGIETYYGMLQGASARNGILTYTLPSPSLDSRAYPQVTTTGELQQRLDQSFGDWEGTRAINGVDALYKGITPAFHAWFQLSPEIREQIEEQAPAAIQAGLKPNRWQEHVEPFSGLNVFWTYDIEGPFYSQYDQEWGNGLSLYGLCKYAQYSGNWSFLAQNWDGIRKMWSWLTKTDDWVWMRSANASHGHGTGAGDCSLAAFSGAWAYAKISEQLGFQGEVQEGRYFMARAAVPLIARFQYNEYAQQHGWTEANQLIIGFHEGEGFLTGALDRYPWDATSIISGNGIHPEAMDFLLKYAKGDLERYVQTFETHYPHWADGAHDYGFSTLYHGNSHYITMPHLYLRARLGWTEERLLQALEQTRANTALAWVAPPAVNELIAGRKGVILTRWEPSRLTEARLEDSTLFLKGETPPGSPLNLKIQLPTRPIALHYNDAPQEGWNYNPETRELFYMRSAQGEWSVTLHLSEGDGES